MISSGSYPYPVNDHSPARRAALQPHIYSPSESHNSPRNTMYPHLHTSGSPSPGYIYSGYEQYYPKDTWVAAIPSSWSTFYPLPRSSSLPEAAVNPKMTIRPPQPILVSDIDTPSSISSHSILTPSSPFARHDDVDETDFQTMDFDEFDYDDEEDYVDSDLADDMEGIDEEPSSLYGASAPHVVKSTSALEGALGDTLSPSYDTDIGVPAPADRRLSASVPGYPGVSCRSSVTTHDHCADKMRSPGSTSSPPASEASYPSHMYTQRSYSSSFAPTSPSLYNHMSSSSALAGAFTSSHPSHQSRTIPNSLPILQPQPIRPIPPIPLADLASSANEISSLESHARAPHPSRTLSPLPLLCQPVADAIRYQLKGPSASAVAVDDNCYDKGNVSGSTCVNIITVTEDDGFAHQGLAICHEHQSTNGSCSVEEKMYSCGCVDLPIRWQ